LRRVDDRGSEHAAEYTSVTDGERATVHVFYGELSIACFLCHLPELLFNVQVVHVVAITQHRHHETLFGCYGDAHVDVVTINDLVGGVVDDGVDNGLILKSIGGGLDEGRHEAQLDTVFLEEGVLVLLPESDDVCHVDLVEGGQHGASVLGVLQALGDSQAHAVHLHTLLSAGSCADCWCC